MHAEDVKKALQAVANKKKKAILQRFFKTGKGEYGEGDVFWGVTVPEQRRIAKQHLELGFTEVEKLLASEVHEHRLTGLLILVYQYAAGKNKHNIYDFYLAHTSRVNNWDLVDCTADKIVGEHLLTNGQNTAVDQAQTRKVLDQLVRSTNLWERRISIVATYQFIKAGQFSDTLRLAKQLLGDTHDLMHKATGWMLREVGKRDKQALITFLERHVKEMPRTMLRYAIERFPEEERQSYLKR